MRRIILTTSLVYETALELTEEQRAVMARWVHAQMNRHMAYPPLPHTHHAETETNLTVLEESDT